MESFSYRNLQFRRTENRLKLNNSVVNNKLLTQIDNAIKPDMLKRTPISPILDVIDNSNFPSFDQNIENSNIISMNHKNNEKLSNQFIETELFNNKPTDNLILSSLPTRTHIITRHKTSINAFEYLNGSSTQNLNSLDLPLMELNDMGGIFSPFLQRRSRGEKRPIPDEQKDEKYYERRKRNNEAAKKSRDARKIREDRIALRAAFLEQENSILRTQILALRDELQTLRQIISLEIEQKIMNSHKDQENRYCLNF
uniref:BZIP domain-containing protein n=1 Tax=Glossina brevipalpis TaxID=37001 RepID=A0A1A9W0U0_9MUSC